MAEPKCPNPECGVEGIENIISKLTPLKRQIPKPKDIYEVIFCTQCGHIYGVFPKAI